MHPAGQILVGSGLGHIQTVFLHDCTLVVLFTTHLFIYLHFHFHFKLSHQMCFGPSCFPLYLFFLVWFQRVICKKKHRTIEHIELQGQLWSMVGMAAFFCAIHGCAWFPLLLK